MNLTTYDLITTDDPCVQDENNLYIVAAVTAGMALFSEILGASDCKINGFTDFFVKLCRGQGAVDLLTPPISQNNTPEGSVSDEIV